MTDKEAIEYAKKDIQSTGYTLETNSRLRGGLFKILSTKFDFLVIAKSAIQERLDREKGFEPLTNADRIRAMSDEELAIWLEYEGGGACSEVSGWLDWLRQPAEGEQHGV